MTKKLIYVYCVSQRGPNIKDLDLGDNGYTICHKGLYAVVSKVSEDEFSEENLKKNLADLDWIKAKASVHERIIEGAMKDACVIPFKFGTIFNTEDNLKTMLEKHMEEFIKNLKNLEGKEEWGVKIYRDIERLKGTIIKEEAKILRIENEINSSPPGKAYFIKRKKEELLKGTVTRRTNEYGQKSFEILKVLSFEARINKLLPKEVTEREDDMVLNSAFLVEKSKIADFLNAADGLNAKYNDKGLNFDCTGPWPPYNFCNLSKEKLQNG